MAAAAHPARQPSDSQYVEPEWSGPFVGVRVVAEPSEADNACGERPAAAFHYPR